MDVKIEQSWKQALQSEFDKPYFAELVRFLHAEKSAGQVIYPPGKQIFRAFELTPLDKVKVVILGQDPYHGYGQAMGLSFSVPDGVPAPPSLKNIFKEIEDDLGIRMSGRPNLEDWARQGVLLLNAVLTVRASQPASHSAIGWQEFTDAVIRCINDRCDGVVFLLWGSFARAKRELIDTSRHYVLDMKKTAFFPGSFDPFTAGHLNILKRALTMFDEVVIAVGINQDKRGFFDMDQRMDIIRQATAGMEGVRVIKYDSLTVDACRQLGIRHIVRGVRNMLDFENERAIADANRRIAPEIETVIIPTAQEFAHISSSAVRDILKHKGDTSLFLSDGVVLPDV